MFKPISVQLSCLQNTETNICMNVSSNYRDQSQTIQAVLKIAKLVNIII